MKKLHVQIAVNAVGVTCLATALSVPFRMILTSYQATENQTGAAFILGFISFIIFGIGNLAANDIKD